MSKFNLLTRLRPRTHQGGIAYKRDTRTELFLLAISNLVGETSCYEQAQDRDNRYAALVRAATLADPEWTARLLAWLRTSANLRSAALVGAAEFAKARLDNGLPGQSRQVIDSVLRRADEPGELLGYWTARHGRAIPKPVKRGIADAVRRLYDERSALKWDSVGRDYRFADVLELTHPAPLDQRQGLLFRRLIDERHGRAGEPAGLPVLRARQALTALPVEARRAKLTTDPAQAVADLREAGMTWEAVAGWRQGPLDAAAWSAVIPSMGYMALLRNLRNFDQAGISDQDAAWIGAKLADPAQVARSKQLPLRFLSAYRAAGERWSGVLDTALGHSLAAVPRLSGRTLVLIDTSYSMTDSFSRDGTLKRWDAAVVFGLALAARAARPTVVSYSDESRVFPVRPDEPVLRGVRRWQEEGYFLGQGTDTVGALRTHFRGHDRVVLLTDEQHGQGDVHTAVPARVPLYTWNLAGYATGHTPVSQPGRHTFGGLSDRSFDLLTLVERGERGDWPF
ncbi:MULTISPECIES: TROVE domain-containing protein [unclassified Crossiella]|uniref:TROVE domain-containing protein n=1 Tax=unclassified Crossiella TaxID=2620835 RepID=UPI001FFF0781|nr:MULTISPECIES: TROVE domain-containing protein [unclassified Crossiella]MCK2240174.1 TROVE domain-containing protein [Crossiella sp. S99.2]MCK2253374.1 TROVE domain-containing protein [Crossiella sp. S99.1]